jgi:dipeptidyl aminopeptidase/acylaminoacyl peptidase
MLMDRKHPIGFAFGITIAAVGFCSVSEGAGLGRPFTVSESIALTRISDLDGFYRAKETAAVALFSPDGGHFVIRTRRGKLDRNLNIECILLFDTRTVDSYLNGAAASGKPTPRILAEIEVTDEWASIANIHWIDSRQVAFVANGRNGHNQAFVANIGRKAPVQLTDSQTNVESFAIAGKSILYYAHTARRAKPDVEALANRRFADLLGWWDADESFLPMKLVRTGQSNANVPTLASDAIRLPPGLFSEIWSSPSGRYAVTLTPSVNVPKTWEKYQTYDGYWSFKSVEGISDSTSTDLALRPRYQLVDLKTGAISALLDAPAGYASFNHTPREVFWTKGERSVIVSNTYLPLADNDRAGQQVALSPVTAEVDLQSRAATPILIEPAISRTRAEAGEQLLPIVSLKWDDTSNKLNVWFQTQTGGTRVESYQKFNSDWRKVAESDGNTSNRAVSIQRVESLTERPKLFAIGHKCACRKEIFDPNPDAENLQFGRLQSIRWTDKNGNEWTGGLLYPSDYSPGRRYPLVVQTHGFNPNEFLIDGPSDGTAFAAQALASSGIVVAQVAEPSSTITSDDRQGDLMAEGYRALIAKYIDEGVADPKRVGLIAFSATGLPAIHLLASQPDLLAAINISDSVQPSYVQTVWASNDSAVAADSLYRLVGGAPAEVGYSRWFAQSPLYKLSRIRAAVRIEAMDPSGAAGLAETYSVLRDAHRPVDFIFFHRGNHNLYRPAERLGSQGGNVDWFRFWLQDYEDPDIYKRDQYDRWRQLRALRDGDPHEPAGESAP